MHATQKAERVFLHLYLPLELRMIRYLPNPRTAFGRLILPLCEDKNT